MAEITHFNALEATSYITSPYILSTGSLTIPTAIFSSINSSSAVLPQISSTNKITANTLASSSAVFGVLTSSSGTIGQIGSTGSITANTIASSSANISSIYSTGTITTPKIRLNPLGSIDNKLTNRTTGTSVIGTAIHASTQYSNAFCTESEEFDVIGFVAEDGTRVGDECWVAVRGITKVFLVDGSTVDIGNWCYKSTIPGRIYANRTVAGVGSSEHFKEVGHALEGTTGGTNIAINIAIHLI